MSRPDSPPVHIELVTALPPAEVLAALQSPGTLSPALRGGRQRGTRKAPQPQPGSPRLGAKRRCVGARGTPRQPVEGPPRQHQQKVWPCKDKVAPVALHAA